MSGVWCLVNAEARHVRSGDLPELTLKPDVIFGLGEAARHNWNLTLPSYFFRWFRKASGFEVAFVIPLPLQNINLSTSHAKTA